MKIVIIAILLINILLAEIKVGESFPSLKLVDQFDKKVELPQKGHATIIISFEKEVSSSIKKFMDTQDKNFLKKHNITYISDISTVPSLLINWIVLPKLKKFLFRVALIYDDSGRGLNRQKGKVSLFRLEDNRVVDIKFVDIEDLNLSDSKIGLTL